MTLTRCIVCDKEGVPGRWNNLSVRVCPSCGLAWRTTFDVPVEYYEHLESRCPEEGGEKANARQRNAEDRIRMVRSWLPLEGICDVGCGDGSFLQALRDAGYAGWGMEPGAKNVSAASAKGIEVVQGTVKDLPRLQQGRPIEAITFFHVLEHLPDPLRALNIFARALKKGGMLLLETPDSQSALQRVTNHENQLVYQEHLFYWNRGALRKALMRAGFEVACIKRRSFDWRHTPISTSLLRLGLRKRNMQQASGGSSASPDKQHATMHGSWLRRAARTFLAYLAHFLQRDDYVLVVAKRVV